MEEKKYAGYKDGKIVAKSKFGLNKMQYKVPDGLLYPVVAAFRSLLVKNKVTGKYEWKNGVGPLMYGIITKKISLIKL
ncbi:MAG: hypothetical protein ACLU9P_12215 [[Ruminococcus] torques]